MAEKIQEPELTAQIKWLEDFIERWEKVLDKGEDYQPLVSEYRQFCANNDLSGDESADDLLLDLMRKQRQGE